MSPSTIMHTVDSIKHLHQNTNQVICKSKILFLRGQTWNFYFRIKRIKFHDAATYSLGTQKWLVKFSGKIATCGYGFSGSSLYDWQHYADTQHNNEQDNIVFFFLCCFLLTIGNCVFIFGKHTYMFHVYGISEIRYLTRVYDPLLGLLYFNRPNIFNAFHYKQFNFIY